jgi:potassium-transporting ATPase ATP-binding subunit
MSAVGKLAARTETPPAPVAPPGRARPGRGLFDREILGRATVDAFRKLDPRVQVKNPVMFVVLIGTVVTLAESVAHPGIFDWSVTFWLALTVLFANFAEAVAEGRGKAQAGTLRRMRSDTEARRLRPEESGAEERIPAAELVKGDLVICEAGDLIPSDGEITDGVASVDESAITGESAPVIREAAGDRSADCGWPSAITRSPERTRPNWTSARSISTWSTARRRWTGGSWISPPRSSSSWPSSPGMPGRSAPAG